MAKLKWSWLWPRASSYGTSVKPSAAAPPTRNPARPSGQEKRSDSRPRLSRGTKPLLSLYGACALRGDVRRVQRLLHRLQFLQQAAQVARIQRVRAVTFRFFWIVVDFHEYAVY